MVALVTAGPAMSRGADTGGKRPVIIHSQLTLKQRKSHRDINGYNLLEAAVAPENERSASNKQLGNCIVKNACEGVSFEK